jgi:hypothetical protein
METDDSATDALLRDLAGASGVSTDSFVDRLVERLRLPLWVAVHDAEGWPAAAALPAGAEVVDCGGGATALVFQVEGVEAARGLVAALARSLPGGARLVVAVGLGATGATLDGPVFDAVRALWRGTAALGPGVYLDASSVEAAPGPCAPVAGGAWRLALPARHARRWVLAVVAAGALAAGALMLQLPAGGPTEGTPPFVVARFDFTVERAAGLRGGAPPDPQAESVVLNTGDVVTLRVEKGQTGRLTILRLGTQGVALHLDPEGRPVMDRAVTSLVDRLVSDGEAGETQLAALITPAPLGEAGLEAVRAAAQAAAPAEQRAAVEGALAVRFGAGVAQVLVSPRWVSRR